MEFLNKYANLLLVIITSVYVYYTFKMSKAMSKQVISDIEVDNIIVGSELDQRHVTQAVSNFISGTRRSLVYIKFKITFDVRNRSSANGSIDKPFLHLKFTNDNYQIIFKPVTKNEEWVRESSSVSSQIVTDLGGTIFLQGGASEKVELEYHEATNNEELLKHVNDNITSLEYYISYKNNLGKEFLLRVTNIKELRQVGRR